MNVRRSTVLVGGSVFTESPRWHDGRLWYLDIPAHTVRAVGLDGRDEVICKLADRIGAIDFLPDGTLLAALADKRQIIRLSDQSLYADLSELGTEAGRFFRVGDMVIDGAGRLYIDATMPGRDLDRPAEDIGDAIVVVEPGGACRVAARGVHNSNGMAVTPGGGSLVAAEPLLSRLVSFAIADDGGLGDLEVFADIAPHEPDGICTDSQGAIWSSGIHTREVIRVTRGGEVTDRIAAADEHWTIATMIGGPDRRHLFIATSYLPTGSLRSREDAAQATGFIEVAEIDVPGGGWPGN